MTAGWPALLYQETVSHVYPQPETSRSPGSCHMGLAEPGELQLPKRESACMKTVRINKTVPGYVNRTERRSAGLPETRGYHYLYAIAALAGPAS